MKWHSPASTALAFVLLLAGGCKDKTSSPSGSGASGSAAPEPAPAASSLPAPVLLGNAERGKALLETYECNRCHQGTGLAAADFHKDCYACHRDIIDGKFKVKDLAKVERWKKNVVMVQHTPSLDQVGKRLKREWIAAFLQQPKDLRPNLVPTMPPLRLTAQQAADIAAHLTKGSEAAADLALGDAERGRQLMAAKACGTCHVFSGADLPIKPVLAKGQSNPAIELAPDLRFARERVGPAALVRWLREPEKVKPGTLMPNLGLSETEAKDIAAYVLQAQLGPQALPEKPKRLPKLERKVSFEEVQEKVLNRTCAHCHGNPDIARGDGGPGNTGGFGYKPRQLDLSKYSGIASGYVDDAGERHSVYSPMKDGTPRIVAALWARHDEQRGSPNPELRGMPLGMPALPAEDIQVLESWIAQGRPR
ncbi:MAG: cytochrome c [Polyangiaceae bacterium]